MQRDGLQVGGRERVPLRRLNSREVLAISNRKLKEGRLIFENYQERKANLFIGCKLVARNSQWLLSKGIRKILNVSKEKNYFFDTTLQTQDGTLNKPFDYKQIKIEDALESNMYQWFDECCAWIESSLQSGESVLVHCSQGLSRSVTMIIAFAMRCKSLPLVQAYETVLKCNGKEVIGDGFKLQLMDYEKKIFGRNSYDFFDRKRRRESCQRISPFLPRGQQLNTTIDKKVNVPKSIDEKENLIRIDKQFSSSKKLKPLMLQPHTSYSSQAIPQVDHFQI